MGDGEEVVESGLTEQSNNNKLTRRNNGTMALVKVNKMYVLNELTVFAKMAPTAVCKGLALLSGVASGHRWI